MYIQTLRSDYIEKISNHVVTSCVSIYTTSAKQIIIIISGKRTNKQQLKKKTEFWVEFKSKVLLTIL